MLDSEKQDILARLDEGRKALAIALDGVDEKQAAWKPVVDRWSILECVEHLTVAEEYLRSRLEAARPAKEAHTNRAREAAILSRAVDRNTRIESPDVGLPRGRFCNLQEAVARFATARARTVDWVNAMDRDPRSCLTDHPLIKGPVNCYEILLMIAAHPKRHSEQISLIRSSLPGR